MDQIPFEDFREEWLTEVREGNPSTTELGHRFAHKLLTQWLDISDASDDLVYCDGAGDGGIDIAYLYRGDDEGNSEPNAGEGHIWYLVQSKYGSAFAGINTLLAEGQKVIDTLDGQRSKLSSLTTDLLERLNGFRRQASELDRILLVFATEKPLSSAETRVLNDLRAMGRQRLGSIFDVEAISVDTIYQRMLEREELAQAERIRVPLRAQLVPSGHDLLVGSISLLDLYDFLKRYRNATADLDRIYEKNVRRFLGSRGKINKAIHQTLQNSPERFGLYNNGVTLVVQEFSKNGDDELILTEPFIVNGCQTTKSIWEVFHNRLETGGTGIDPALETWRDRAAQGVVVTKIVKVGSSGESLLQAITRYTNSQNAVREKDFLALTSDFRQWAGQMAAEYGVFLETQRGAWDSRKAFQRQNPDETQFTEHANAFDLLKVYGAGWLGEAGTAYGRNAAFVPGGSIFKRIMNSQNGDSVPFGVDDLYSAYRLQRAADSFQFGRGAPKSSRRQTRFLFYMVVGELLEDVLLRAQLPTDPKSRTKALLKLFQTGNKDAVNRLLKTAIQLVDEYLTEGTEDAVFTEPKFRDQFNNDLNGFLKWEQLGKTEDATPHLRSLISGYRKIMGKELDGKPSDRTVITEAITQEPVAA